MVNILICDSTIIKDQNITPPIVSLCDLSELDIPIYIQEDEEQNQMNFFCQMLEMDLYPIHLFDYSTKQKGVKRF